MDAVRGLKDLLAPEAPAAVWLDEQLARSFSSLPSEVIAPTAPLKAAAGRLGELRRLLASAAPLGAQRTLSHIQRHDRARASAVLMAEALAGGRRPVEVFAAAPAKAAAAAPSSIEEKLGQKNDIAAVPGEERAGELKSLEELRRRWSDILSEPETETGGLLDSKQNRSALLDGLRKELEAGRREDGAPPGSPSPKSPHEDAVAARVGRIEALQGEAQAQLAARDAAAAMLAVAERVRSGALKDRRSGSDMLEFRKNFSRLSMVMDLSYSLGILNSAERAMAGMQALLDAKLAKIDAQRRDNAASAAAAAAQQAQAAAWRQEAQEQVQEDKDQAAVFAVLAEQSGLASTRIGEFKEEVSALLGMINARDKAQSADAPAEYRRRIALLPGMVERMTHGKGGSGVNGLSLDELRSLSADIAKDLTLLKDARARIDGAPLETAGLIAMLVPGIPAVSLHNTQVPEILRILAARQVFWNDLLAQQRERLDAVRRALDGANAARVADDFGDLHPESLVVYRDEERRRGEQMAGLSAELGAKMDALAQSIADKVGANLPALSGRSAAELRELLPGYADALEAMSFPDTEAGFAAKMDKLALAKMLPFLADATIRRIEAESSVKVLDDALSTILPEARARLTEVVAAVETVVADIAADLSFVHAGFPFVELQQVIERKKSLVSTTLQPMLRNISAFLDETLIPFQQKRIAQTDPNSTEDGYGLLYKEKDRLFGLISDAIHKTLPWGLASNACRPGDVAAALAAIAAQRRTFETYASLVADFKDQMRRRKDPDATELEEVYGEQAPYSLPARAKKYRAEKAERAAQINARDGQVNEILKDIDALSPGKNFASRFALPTDLSAEDPAAVSKLRAIADNEVLQNMASELKAVADAASAAAGAPNLEVGGSGEVPTGTQPSPQLSDSQKLSLLCLDAVKRLVPTSETHSGDSIAEALARFLFADALVSSADKNLAERIPIFTAFLARADGALAQVFSDLDADVAFVSGDLSGGEEVLARKIAIYGRVQDIAREGAELFTQKAGWSAEGMSTVADVAHYYDTLGSVYTLGNEALDAEAEAARQFRDAISQSQEQIRRQKETVSGWLKQLNDPRESALARVMGNISSVQDKTRAVLEANTHFHQAEKQLQSADRLLERTLGGLALEQRGLEKDLEPVVDLRRLSPELARRVARASGHGGSWLAAGGPGPQAVIIPKSMLGSFLSQLFGAFTPDGTSRDIAGLRDELLKNPMALSQLLPDSKMIEMGQGAGGFYLVYQSEFSTPHGLESSSQVTLGNVLKLWDNNISVIGHRFGSPPSEGNAPFGDQGVTVRVESLQGANWVNYLDVTFHKQLQDIPGDLSVGSQAEEARMMVFDDFALMLANGRVYFGAAGFADFAAQNASEKPYYYGGSLKTSVKFTEVLSVNAEQSALFAKDPRRFLETVNLDFTRYDPSLDHDFVIDAEGKNKDYRRGKIGVGLDLQKALETKDSFKLDLHFARVEGTDDFTQNAAGATVLKGFSFEVKDVPVKTTLSVTGEAGEKYDTVNARVGFELPNQGLVFNAQGKILGDAQAYLVEVRKKLGSNSEAFVSYGSRYIGLNDRLTLGADTSFSLGQLWRAVAGNSAAALAGGQTLSAFNESLENFFKKGSASDAVMAELRKVFAADVGKRLLSLEIGNLSRDLAELHKAGAIFDNTRVRAMVGFVSNPVGDGTAERATTGGFQAGTQTELTMTKSQRALIEHKIASIYAEGLALQVRLLELTKEWQAALAALMQARWEMGLSGFMAANAQDAVLRAEAQAGLIASRAAYRQASLRYNALTGRGPEEALPFDGLNPQDLDRLFIELRKALGDNRRLARLFASIGGRLTPPKGEFNLMDWIPWVESLTFYAGIQLQDMLSSQILGAGVSIRLPIYDPGAAGADQALVLQSSAVLGEMASQRRSIALRAQMELSSARAWIAASADEAAASQQAADGVADAIRAYRNGLMTQAELWKRFRVWRRALSDNLRARAMAALESGWAVLDATAAEPARFAARRPAYAPPPKTLGEGIDLALKNSESLDALALRSRAAAELLEAASHRISKAAVDLNVGVNITAAGVALIPAFGITGLAVFPVVNVDLNTEELKTLSMARRAGEEAYYDALGGKVRADISLELYQAYVAYRFGQEALRIAPNRELEARQQKLLALINYLTGRPLEYRLTIDSDAEAALSQLLARIQGAAASQRAVLEARVSVARAVETIVDKNLRAQHLRFEPIALIGRALGRLVNALSGDGLASPELVAMAREQTLEAERGLKAFDAGLKSARAQALREMDLAERRLRALAGRSDAASRLQALELSSRLYALKAALASLAAPASGPPAPAAKLPGTAAELRERLQEAFAAEIPGEQTLSVVKVAADRGGIDVRGSVRFFDLRTDLSQAPIGERFTEGWIEVRLKSPLTSPEALVALARLREERSDQLYKARQAQARARADALLASFALNGALARQADAPVEALRALEDDFTLIAAHLGLGAEARAQDLLALFAAVSGEAALEEYLREASRIDLEALRRALFETGLPPELSGRADPLLQLKADMIAEKMSYKGFTPLGAFGIFRGQWVSGAFLEAPEPVQIQKALEAVVSAALQSELQSRRRLKDLALKLHCLMASVSDKIELVGALRRRLETARGNVVGVGVRLSLRMASVSDLAAAQREAFAAHAEFLSTLAALRMDFIMLVAELEALGYSASAFTRSPLRPAPAAAEDSAQKRLLAYWSQRMLDEDFQAKQDALLGSASSALRGELERRVALYRAAAGDDSAVRHSDFTAAEKLELLMKTDLEGRRRRVEEVLARLSGELARPEALAVLLKEDLAAQSVSAEADLKDQNELRRAVADAFWGSDAPEEAQKAYRELSELSARVDGAKQQALAAYLPRDAKPEDFLLRDKALDGYVQALQAYDAALVRAFSGTLDGRWARALNGLFGLKESLERRQDVLRRGRGILTLDAALELSKIRLRALRFDRAAPEEVQAAAENHGFLKAMKERWLSKPDSVPTLYAAGGQWLTEADIASLDALGRVVEISGKRYLLSETFVGRRPESVSELKTAGAEEIVGGADARRDREAAARAREQESLRRRLLDRALERSELVLEASGAPLSLQELRRLESRGRVFYFEAAAGRDGLRAAVHPVAAQWRSPGDLIAMVQISGPSFGFGQFPTLETMRDSAENTLFERAVWGPLGAAALVREAQDKEAAARRMGWLRLKLEGYAYALDSKNEVAAVYMNEDELAAARKKGGSWTFHEVSELSIGLDERRAPVSAGDAAFKVKLGAGAEAAALSGAVHAVELDGDRVMRSFTDEKSLERAAASWWIEDVSGKIWEQTDRNISPVHRLKRYIDPATKLPVALGRPVLARRLSQAESEAGAVGRWAYMPGNWPNILLETPRGIVKTPVELLTGRDPNQEGYIGRVYMNLLEGGDTQRRGLLGRALHFIDIFEILPDPVGRYMDPSQFPARVDNSGPLLPGQWEHEKAPRTVDGDKDVHFGKGSLLRQIRYATEDREDARNRILVHFSGGVRRSFVETINGRAGEYFESTLSNGAGRGAIEAVLRELGSRTGADGLAEFLALPGHLAVERVAASVEITLGAQEQARRRALCEAFLRALEAAKTSATAGLL